MKRIAVKPSHNTTVNQCFDLFVKNCYAKRLCIRTGRRVDG